MTSTTPVRIPFIVLGSALLLGLATPAGLGAFRTRDEPVPPARTRVLLVRHADRDGKADALTEAGIERAKALAHVLEKCAIDAVYHSDRARTKATAAPFCAARGITPIERRAEDVAGLVATLRESHAGETVLVIGHSDTVPRIAKELGAPDFAIPDGEFDDLVLVDFSPEAHSPPTLLRLQYGKPTP